MAGQLSDVGAKFALDYVTGRAVTLASRTTYVALLTAAPTDTTAISGFSEYGATGYARQAITWGTPATTTATIATPGISSAAAGSGFILTYTTSAAHGLVVGQTINITGITGTGTPNQTNVQVQTVPTSTTFTIYAPATATWTSGGSVTGGAQTAGSTGLVTFGPFTAGTGATVTHAALVSSASGTTGDFLAWWALDTSRTPATNDAITIAINALTLSIN